MSAGRRHSPLALALLAGLTLLALAARLCGIGSRLPHQAEPDYVVVSHAAWLDRPAGMESSPEAYPATSYPRLLSFALAALPGRSYARTLPPDAPLEEHLAAAGGPFLRGRLLIALLSLAAVPATYFLARRFLSEGGSLLAAAFLATSLAVQFYSQQARPHAAGMALSLLAMLAILRARASGSAASFALAGLCAALAVGCLWNGVFVVPPLLLAWALAPRRGSAEIPRTRSRIGLAVALAAVALAVPVFYGFLFAGSWLGEGRLHVGGQSIRWKELNGAGFGLILRGMWSFDPVLVAAAGAGLLAWIVRFLRGRGPDVARAKDLAVALAFPAGFLLYWGSMSRVPPRFSLPLAPYVAILAAFGAASLLPARAPRALAAVAAALLLAFPAVACAHLARTRSREDTLTLAARWIAEHADREREVVCIPYLTDLPLLCDRAGLGILPPAVLSPWQRYQLRLPASASPRAYRLREIATPEAITDHRIDPGEVRAIFRAQRPSWILAVMHADSGIGWDSTRDVLREDGAELVARFVPYRPGAEEALDVGFEAGEQALAKTWYAERPGPLVEIYRPAAAEAGR